MVTHRKRQGQDGVPFEMVDKETQQRAMEYMNRQVFATPEWMLDEDIFRRYQPTGALSQIRSGQSSGLNQVLNVARMNRLVEQEAFHGGDAYSLGEMLDDLRAGVWTEVTSGAATDAYRRNLQRAYLDRMKTLMWDDTAMQGDVATFARGQLMTLKGELEAAVDGVSHQATQWHFMDAIVRIDLILDPANEPPPAEGATPPIFFPFIKGK